MATTTAKPKSILKKTTYPATDPETTTESLKQIRDRETALYHANLIQQRKDIELDILSSTETLMDYPLATLPYNASNPSPSDTKQFKDMLRPFQPSDYDALIVERNINDHCGFTLCPNPNVKESGGKYRLLGMRGRAKDFRIVEKEELERWCSEACARRALYVKVQLSERPAWERETSHLKIDLLDEPKADEGMVLDGIERLHISQDEQNKQGHADLALERCDTGRAARNGLVDVTIREKANTGPAEPPSLATAELSGRLDNMHLALEGHVPSFGIDQDSSDDEDETMDWKL